MPNLNLAPFPVDTELTAVAIAYKNPSLIADEVLPIVPVGKQSFKYTKFSLTEGFTIPDTKVGRKSKVNEVEFTATQVDSSTMDYALEDAIPMSDLDNAAENYDPLAHSTEMLTALIKLDREKRVADTVFNGNNYATSNKDTLSGTSQFSDFTNSDPVGKITLSLDSCIMRPNIIVFGQAAWSKVRQHPKIVKAVLGNSGDSGLVSREAVAELFEVEKVLVGQGFLNTAKKGQTPTPARVWGKHIAMIYRDNIANADRGTTFGFTARFGTPVAGYWEDKTIGMKGGIRVRVGESVKEVICANDLGFLLINAVA